MAFIGLAFRAVVLKLEPTSGPPEAVVKHGLLGLISKVSHTIGQGWSQRICMSNGLLGDAVNMGVIIGDIQASDKSYL